MSVSYSVGILLPMFVMYIKDYKCVSFISSKIIQEEKIDIYTACGSYNACRDHFMCSSRMDIPNDFITWLDLTASNGTFIVPTVCCDPPNCTEYMHNCTCTGQGLTGVLDKKLFIKGSSTYGICISEKDTQFWKDFKYKDPTYNDGYSVTYSSNNKTNPYMGYIVSLWFCPAFDTNGDISTYDDINNIYNWLDDIINKQTLSVPIPEIKIDNDIQTYIRDSTLIYSIQNQFYNQIYQQEPYNTKTSGNDFIKIDPIKGYLDYKTTIINYYSSFKIFYRDRTGADYPVGLQNLMNDQDMLVFPKARYISKDGNYTYFLDIKITYSQYRDNIANTKSTTDSKNSYLNGLLQNFFQDTSITVKNTKNIILGSTNLKVQYIEPTEGDKIFTIYSNGFRTIDSSTIPLPSSSEATYAYAYKLLNIKITVKITQWSNMLLAYFLNSYNSDKEVTADICNNVDLQYCNSVPISYLLYKPDEYKQTIENYCGISFTSDNSLTNSLKLILISNTSDICYCYNSRIAPPLDNNGGNKNAMCFDRYCSDNSDMKKAFGLTESNCKSSCDQVYYWMTNNNPADQPLNKAAINWSEFSNICGGSKYTPFKSSYFNINVSITFIIISILLSGVIFLICKHKKYNQMITFIIVFIVFASMMSLSGFLGHYFSGKSMCDGKKLVCSNSRGVNIPQEFCKDIFNCECISSKDCSPGCNCVSSTCYPNNGSRKTTTIKVKKPQKLLIILSVICLITFPLIFYFLYKDYHLNINKKIVIPLIVVISLIPLAYTIIISNIKHDQKIYEEACKYIPPFSCTQNSQCTKGKVCKEGKCQDCTLSSDCKGQICESGSCINCTTNIECEGKICDATSKTCVPCTKANCLNGMYCSPDGLFCYAMTSFIPGNSTTDINIYLTYNNIDYSPHNYTTDNSIQIRSLFYNGSYWLAICDKRNSVGLLFYINSTKVENNSLVQIQTGSSVNLGLGIVKDIAWNENKKIWVAVGAIGSTGSGDQIYVSNSCLSPTELIWTKVNFRFDGYASRVVCNNDYFLIVGKGPNILIRYDGANITPIDISSFFDNINDLVWNEAQKAWVMLGNLSSNSNVYNIIYSIDGTTWKGGNKGIFSYLTSVACNDNIWIAVGGKNEGGDVMAYSSHGDIWYPMGKIFDFEYGGNIIWNGNMFIVNGIKNGKSIIYSSSDGLNWEKLDMTSFPPDLYSITTSFFEGLDICIPKCDGGKNCGPNGCNGVCGTCTSEETCSSDGICTCLSICGEKICGNDNCHNVDACGTCQGGKMCAPDGKSCSNPSEIYYYNSGSEYTEIDARTYANDHANVPIASYQQVLDEYKFENGLDSCYIGWTDNVFDGGNDYFTMVNPYKTQISSSAFCSEPNKNISKNPSTSNSYDTERTSAGLYLYGVKPNLPDCNNSNPNTPCVGRYNKDKMSRYDP